MGLKKGEKAAPLFAALAMNLQAQAPLLLSKNLSKPAQKAAATAAKGAKPGVRTQPGSKPLLAPPCQSSPPDWARFFSQVRCV